jgi:hypothetical protein
MARCPRSLLLLLAFVAPAAAESISGVCPDGSIFVVQRPADIPCSAAKRVEPHEIPPLNPDFLPRPYGWEVFNRQTDPNNPYNLIDAARAQRGEAPAPTTPGAKPPPPAPLPSTTNARPPAPQTPRATPSPPQVAAAPPTRPGASGLDLGLSAQDVRDLALIVELMQERAPATVAVHDDAGGRALTIRVARSEAFEQRLCAGLTAHGTPAAAGPVLLFTAVAEAQASFFGNLTFVQGHVAFHPESGDASQFGILDGRLGPLAAGQSALGYVVLPAHVDLSLPLDIYWNDQLVTATLMP